MYRLPFLLLILIMYDGNRIEFLIALQQQHTHSAMMISLISFSLSFGRLDGLSGGLWEYIRTILSPSLSLFSLSGDVDSGTDNHFLPLSLSLLCSFFSIFFSSSSVCCYCYLAKEEKKRWFAKNHFSSLILSDDKFIVNVER